MVERISRLLCGMSGITVVMTSRASGSFFVCSDDWSFVEHLLCWLGATYSVVFLAWARSKHSLERD